MTREEEVLACYSTPNLRRNVMLRSSKKLNMEFDAQFNKMTVAERNEFLDTLYPEDAKPKEVTHERPDA
jgi:hypothetical protein